MKKRVVITGIGTICSTGRTTEEFWNSCLEGRINIEKIPEKWNQYANFSSKVWSPLPDINFVSKGINRIENKQLDVSSLMALTCTFEALENADLEIETNDIKRNTYKLKNINPDKSGVVIGSGVGGISTLGLCFSNQVLNKTNEKINKLKSLIENNENRDELLKYINEIDNLMIFPKRFNPFAVSMIMPNACSANIGIKFGINGINNTLSSACASGTVAIGYAFNAIKNGQIELAVTGGTEYMNDEYGALFYAFDVIKALTKDENLETANKPFDKNRSGFLYSQGGASIFILEDLEHAQKRGAEIIAEIIEYEENCDAHNIMMIESSGKKIEEMIKNILIKTEIDKSEIDYINTHGTGTPLNDEVESRIIDEIFGKKPIVNSTKSLIGHTLGASGAIETAVTALSLKNKKTHICKNLKDPVRDLNYSVKVEELPIKTAINQSFGFGGHNAVLLMKAYE